VGDEDIGEGLAERAEELAAVHVQRVSPVEAVLRDELWGWW
jgi:hypothetical protein